MDDYDGRPHWGKLHGQRAATLAPRYPQWDDVRRGPRPSRSRPHVRQPVPRPRARMTGVPIRSRRSSTPPPPAASRRSTGDATSSRRTSAVSGRSSRSPATPTCWPTSTPPSWRRTAPTATAARPNRPSCNGSPAPTARSAASTSCSSPRAPPGPSLPRRADLDDHPRVRRAAGYRTDLAVYGDDVGLVVLGEASPAGGSSRSSCSTPARRARAMAAA